MDRLTVGQCHHAEDARRDFTGTRNLAPEADAAIRLLLATERDGDDLSAPSRIDVGTLGAYPLLKVSRRLHTAASPTMSARQVWENQRGPKPHPSAASLHPGRSGGPACRGQRSGPGSRLHGTADGAVQLTPHQPRQPAPVYPRQRASPAPALCCQESLAGKVNDNLVVALSVARLSLPNCLWRKIVVTMLRHAHVNEFTNHRL